MSKGNFYCDSCKEYLSKRIDYYKQKVHNLWHNNNYYKNKVMTLQEENNRLKMHQGVSMGQNI